MFCYLLRDTCCFGDSAQPYAFGCFVVTASRCKVAAHAATFVLWLRRLHELANPWTWFKCFVMLLNPCLAKFCSQLFPLLCCLVFRLCEKACLVHRLCEKPWFPVSARDVVGPDSARSIVAQSRGVGKFCGRLSILAFSLHA